MQLNLHRGNTFISRAILWQTRGKYSHASVTLRDGRVIEAREFKGVRCLPRLEPAPGEHIDVFEVLTTEFQAIHIELFLARQLGKQYDYLSILRFLTREPVPHWNKRKWFCSELAFEAFRFAGIELLRGIEPWAVSPELLSLSPVLQPVSAVQAKLSQLPC